jgi:hypothetical protein
MTFIAAWKLKNEIFIVGDSAVTLKHFPEYVYENKIRNTPQNALKIYNIEDKYILGYAGRADVAYFVINEIRENITRPIVDVIYEATELYGSAIQLVIGYFEGENSKLLTFNEEGKFEIKFHNSYTLIGKKEVNVILESFTPELIGFINKQELINNADDKLISFSACMQSILIRANLLDKGIGGTFSGAYLTKQKFVPQKDTGYITFELNPDALPTERSPNKLFRNPRFVFVFRRANRLATYSMNSQRKYQTLKLISHYEDPSLARNYKENHQKEIYEWKKLYERAIYKKINKIKLKYFVFLSFDTSAYNKITLIHNYLGSVNFVFDIYWRNGYPTLNLSNELVKDINPRFAESLNEFQWITKKNLVWYLKNLFAYLFKKIILKIKSTKIRD